MKKMLLAILTAAAVLASGPGAWSSEIDAGRPGAKTPRMTAKPTAPIQVRWLSAGEDGIVSLEIVCGVSYVGATVRLIAPGIGRPLVAQLPAAAAGEVQPAEWTLNRAVRGPLRAIVEIDTGEQTMASTAVASAGTRKSDRQPAAGAPSDAGPSNQKLTSETLVELPAEQTIRRKGD